MAERQLPCPDCGSPVRPDSEQLCPRCGYPLMFLRQTAEHDARAVPRSPNERDDGTGLMPPPVARTQRTVPAPLPGQRPCPQCGYGNEYARIRCERCGFELRAARPQAVVLGPPPVKSAPSRGGWGWLIAVLVLAALAVLALVAVLAYVYLA